MTAFVLTFILAACSLLYELMIAQTISLLAINNVVWYSLTVGLFIGSMGWGALISGRVFKGMKLWDRLVLLEIVLSLVGGFSVLAVYLAHVGAAYFLIQGPAEIGSVLFFLVAFLVAVLVGLLSGVELPLLIELAESSSGRDRSSRVIAMDYLGSLTGALLFALLLVPRVDTLKMSWMVALVNLAAAAGLAFRFRTAGGGNYAGFLTIFSGVFVALWALSSPVEQFFLRAYYYYEYPKGETRSPVEHHQTPYQSIDIVTLGAERNSVLPKVLSAYSQKYVRAPQLPRGLALYLNKDFQFYSDVEEFYHETFAHVPIEVAGKVPRRVLIMGGGDGLLLRELLKYPQLERVVMVEIDPGVVGLFSTDPRLWALTAGAYNDRRLTLVYDDAYHYIRNCTEEFDAVFLDFPAPTDFALSKLYSREFYKFTYHRLAPDGYLVTDAPGIMEDLRSAAVQGDYKIYAWQVMSATLEAAGFPDVHPYFSALEDDNPRALEVLQREYNISYEQPGSGKYSQEELKQHLGEIVDNVASGFILARKIKDDSFGAYKDYGIELNVMNEKRYLLSITPRRAFTWMAPDREINSILRPRFPELSGWWRIRTPY